MNPTAAARFRNRLLELAKRVGADAATVADDIRQARGGQADGGLSNAPMHLGDLGTEEFLHEMNAALLENEEYLVGEAVAALARIDEGTFGLCERCHAPIAQPRLDAMPYARHCVQCADQTGAGCDVNLNAVQPTYATARTLERSAATDAAERLVDGKLPSQRDRAEHADDVHEVGAAGGGTSVGGLAGTNLGHGDPDLDELRRAAGEGPFDDAPPEDEMIPQAGPSGGALGGTPVGKRTSRQ